jgi:hypothetical protein
MDVHSMAYAARAPERSLKVTNAESSVPDDLDRIFRAASAEVVPRGVDRPLEADLCQAAHRRFTARHRRWTLQRGCATVTDGKDPMHQLNAERPLAYSVGGT